MDKQDESEEKLGVNDTVNGLFSVEKRAKHKLNWALFNIWLLDQPVDEVVIVLLEVKEVPAENVAGMHLG